MPVLGYVEDLKSGAGQIQISSPLLMIMDSGLTGATVCLFARLQEEGYDQALNIPKTIQVGLCLCVNLAADVLTGL